jgi:membrane protein DedA with SNARE-associated domain
MDAFAQWLTGLPTGLLYIALGAVAAAENFFPPIPADTIVALGSFLAARGKGSAFGACLAVWIGNVGGAMVMYALGRRYGAERLERRLMGAKGPSAERRLHALYGKYGIGALFVSRFIPGVRALVPPFAGALRVPPARAALAMGTASAIWYGVVSYLGFRAGADWEALKVLIARDGLALAIAALIIIAIGGIVWWLRSRRTSAPEQ